MQFTSEITEKNNANLPFTSTRAVDTSGGITINTMELMRKIRLDKHDVVS